LQTNLRSRRAVPGFQANSEGLLAGAIRAAHGRQPWLEGRRKKAQPLPAGPWKFWERMPERQFWYAGDPDILQVRSALKALRKLQLDLRLTKLSVAFWRKHWISMPSKVRPISGREYHALVVGIPRTCVAATRNLLALLSIIE